MADKGSGKKLKKKNNQSLEVNGADVKRKSKK